MAVDGKQEKIMAYRAYGARVEELQKQSDLLSRLVAENKAAIVALDNLPREQTFFSIGAGVFVKAKLVDAENVIVEAGAKILAEKSIGDAKKLLAERRTQLESALARTRAETMELTNKLRALEQELNSNPK